jgi:hypothetical protein
MDHVEQLRQCIFIFYDFNINVILSLELMNVEKLFSAWNAYVTYILEGKKARAAQHDLQELSNYQPNVKTTI